MAARARSLALLLAAVVGCAKAPSSDERETATAPSSPASERVELRVEATGLDAAQVEAQVVERIEAALAELAGLEHLRAESVDGRARVELEITAERYAATMDEIRARMAALDGLPAGVVAPRPYELGSPDARVSYVLASETHDLNELGRALRELESAARRSAGVVRVESCAPQARLFVELEPARLQAQGLAPGAVATSLRARLGADEPVTLAALRGHVVDGRRLAELAAFRVSFRAPSCVAADASGIAASLRVELASPELVAGLDAALERAAAGWPPSASLRRVSPDADTLWVSLAPGIDVEAGAELLGGGFGSNAPPWLVEVGTRAPPCWGTGERARMSLPLGAPARDIGASLRQNPDVAAVELTSAESLRLWLLGEDIEVGAQRLVEVAGISTLDVHAPAAQPEVSIEVDDARLAALGLERAEFDVQLELIEGVEIGQAEDAHGELLPVILATTSADASLDALTRSSEAALVVGEQLVPLRELASIRVGRRERRRCRRDGQAAVLVSVGPDAGQELDALKLRITAALQGHSWAPGWP